MTNRCTVDRQLQEQNLELLMFLAADEEGGVHRHRGSDSGAGLLGIFSDMRAFFLTAMTAPVIQSRVTAL